MPDVHQNATRENIAGKIEYIYRVSSPPPTSTTKVKPPDEREPVALMEHLTNTHTHNPPGEGWTPAAGHSRQG